MNLGSIKALRRITALALATATLVAYPLPSVAAVVDAAPQSAQASSALSQEKSQNKSQDKSPQVLPCEQANSQCAFVLLTADGDLKVHNKQWANTRFSPFSTFKIPNSLIALDLGIVSDLSQTMSADTKTYAPEGWWPSSWTAGEHTLRSAYQVSNVPIYRAIATQVGAERMQGYLNNFDYGNRDISAGIDVFWLGVSLQISPIEQAQFLQRLYSKQLPLKTSTYALLKPLMLNHDTPDYKIYGKTGAGTFSPTKAQGWFVGVVEENGKYHYFAAHGQSTTLKHIAKHRKDIARAYLAHYQLPHTIQ